ncbi:hypothetical protein KQI86_12330 [Clostridium sp. MSJ-11]|uniref:ABC transporter permease n=1 Tax=Clostridium mobile TaxID=2841512 RepID=A0ABS6EK02_9CLOT|nr:hypothetical protein [Clostridium mobile]MBU5485122.1 hypothetical protein [Clostridium mobile]
MDRIRKIFLVSINNIRKWATNPRIYVLFILITMFLWSSIRPILSFSKEMGIRVTPWVFPHLASSFVGQLILMLGVVLLFCDAPFIDEGQPYFLIRSGRYTWGMGQVFYIMMGMTIYLLIVNFISILILMPNIFLSTGWGKILGTLAENHGESVNEIEYISKKILLSYTPLKAFVLSFILEWCAGTALALLMFVINICLNRAAGATIASLIILLDYAIYSNFPSVKFFYFSPVSLSKLILIDSKGISNYPSNEYAYIFFIITIIVLSIISVLSVRRKDIQVQPAV